MLESYEVHGKGDNLVIKEKLNIVKSYGKHVVDLTNYIVDEYNKNRRHLINSIRKLPAVINSLNQIKEGDTYRAVVPPEYLNKLKDKSMELIQMDNELFCPTLRDAATKKFVCHIQLEEVNPKIFELSSQMALQSTISDMTYQLEEISAKLDKMLRGQQNDRLALVDSCEQQLLEALNVNDDVLRRYMLANVVKTSNDARAQLFRNFKDDIRFFEEIPTDGFAIQLRHLTNSNFHSDLCNRLSSLHETYGMIARASQILVFVYQELKQQKCIEISIRPLLDMLEDISKNDALRNKLYAYDVWNQEIEIRSLWHKDPVRTVQTIVDTMKNIETIDLRTWEFEIKGIEIIKGADEE